MKEIFKSLILGILITVVLFILSVSIFFATNYLMGVNVEG